MKDWTQISQPFEVMSNSIHIGPAVKQNNREPTNPTTLSRKGDNIGKIMK